MIDVSILARAALIIITMKKVLIELILIKKNRFLAVEMLTEWVSFMALINCCLTPSVLTRCSSIISAKRMTRSVLVDDDK